MPALLARLVVCLRPRDGWTPFLLTLTALLCLPAALSVKGDNAEVTSLIVLSALSVLFGLWLARSRISPRSAAILGALVGMAVVVLAVSRILPPVSLLWSELDYALSWFRDWLQSEIAWPLPFTTALTFTWQRTSAFGSRLWWWGQAVVGNTQTQDRIVAQLLVTYLVWATSLFATWHVYRRRAALLGLAPTGIMLAVVAFFRGEMAFFYLAVYLFCTLWMVAICRLWRHTERWDQQGTDYPDGLGLELTISYGPWLVMILVLAALFPVVYPHRVHQAFWEMAEEPWERVVAGAERFAGPIDEGYPGGPGYGPGEGGELPSANLLTGGPALSDTVVLYVYTSDPAPPHQQPKETGTPLPVYPRRYWRSRTYDSYTGQGWVNSPLDSQSLAPNEALSAAVLHATGPGGDLHQQFQRLARGETWLYAANAPRICDVSVQVWERAPGDLAFLTGEAENYTVISRVPEPSVRQLRSSSPITTPLPLEIAGRYLGLPDAVPDRVLALAREVAGDAPTRYDQALAIERYLRAYPYTLDLPEPPRGRDLVDYFLFEQQEGYCDYYASAMVVMARAVGVPARLASGYAQGSYDQDAHRWVVTEQDSHSWVEVYFDGIGWVEFEPTAGQPALDRPSGLETTGLSLPPLPAPTLPWWREIPWAAIAIAGFVLVLGAVVFRIWRPRPAMTATQLIRDRQARLLRWGARLGHSLRDGQTAQEYGESLGQALRSRGRRARWSRVRRSGDEVPPAVGALTDAYVRAQYGPAPIAEREGWHIRKAWTRLRRHLWTLWLATGLSRDRDG